jgi:hypothetical protein
MAEGPDWQPIENTSITRKYYIRNQEPAETNGGHLQAASPGKIPGPAGASGRIHFGV